MSRKSLVSLLIVCMMLASAMLAGCSYDSGSSSGSSASGTSDNGNASESSGTESNLPAAASGELKIGLDVDPDTLDPRLGRNTSNARVAEVVFSGLVRLTEKLEPVPDLAEKWELPDPKTIVFTLRKDVAFHDGTPFTSADVKYTYDSIRDLEFKAPNAKLYEAIDSVEATDDYTVKFTLKQPSAPLLYYLDLGIVPKHIGEKNDGTLATNPIGTGPYKFVKWDKNSKLFFEVYDKYHDGVAKTKQMTYFVIPDNTTRVSALEAGDIDFVHSPLSPQDINRIKDNDKFTVTQTEGLGYTYLSYNQKNQFLSDVKVRQAIAHLTNKQVISADIYQNMDKPAKSPLIPPLFAHTDDIQGFDYDPEKAKALLAEAGWTDTNGDGMVDKDGKKLSIELSTYVEDSNRVQALEYLQNEFVKAGVDAKVVTTEAPTFLANLLAHKYDIAMFGLLNIVDPDKAVYNQWTTTGGNNYGEYSNPQVDELLEKGRTTSNLDERKQYYQEAAQMMVNDVAFDIVLYQGYIVMHSNKLSGFTLHPKGSFYNFKNAVIK
ncbi:hypothetical protein J4772_23365 [Cohnella sp. LGH]|uniref:ABC transporter substrate-binding protein n=1 Tax=Cohnella sp. LGH TaxID=1619153 RepID=UPI001AD96663|nr:ABC transporter substrate-binding protein [Cohnella sp. LGH]QTH40512.1 hypothetical protein J4772_23365 [Cohnella sp. LGH]